MTFSKKVKKYLQELQTSYRMGLIDYPRIENNYIKDERLHEFIPHKPFFIYEEAMSYIKDDELKIDKTNSLLYLSEKRLISPSQTQKFADTIDTYLSDDLDYLSEKQEQKMQKMQKIFINFIAKKTDKSDYKQQVEYVKEKYDSIFNTNSASYAYIYKIRGITFLPNFLSGTKKKRSISDLFSLKEKIEKLKNKQKAYLEMERIKDAISDFYHKLHTNKENLIKTNRQIKEVNAENKKLLEKYTKE